VADVSRYLPNHIHAIFVYSLENAKEFAITDGMSDARYPVFDKGGKYLFFAASTDEGTGCFMLIFRIPAAGFAQRLCRGA